MTTDKRSLAHKIADVLWDDRYGQTLTEWVEERRGQGAKWRHIAAEIEARTDVPFNHATLLGWFPELADDADRPAA